MDFAAAQCKVADGISPAHTGVFDEIGRTRIFPITMQACEGHRCRLALVGRNDDTDYRQRSAHNPTSTSACAFTSRDSTVRGLGSIHPPGTKECNIFPDAGAGWSHDSSKTNQLHSQSVHLKDSCHKIRYVKL